MGKDPFRILRNIKLRNVNRLVVGHLNINSIRNKIEPLKKIIQGNTDILVLTETKIDESFPSKQFEIEGYSLFRSNNCADSGGILIYVRDDIPCRELKINSCPKKLEGIFLEVNLRKTKWLLFGGYNNNKLNIDSYLGNLGPMLDKKISKIEKLLLLGDFNSEITEPVMNNFCETYSLENLITEPTCFKNPLNPSSIDVMLTNKSRSFINSVTVETGLSDHHKLTISVMRSFFPKQAPTLIKYRNYRKFNSYNFRLDLLNNLPNINEDAEYEEFESGFIKILNKHAPMKEKLVRANNAPFMNKTLSKAIMNRSRLKNKYHNNPNALNKANYNKQRNYCVNVLRREKKKYYGSLNINTFTDNKKFWNTINPFFSEKNTLSRKITLIENETIVSTDAKVADIMNNFFSNTVNKLGIEGYKTECVSDKNTDNVNRAIYKFKNHPSISKIKEKVLDNEKFSFSRCSLKDIEDKINALNKNKPTTSNTIPAKILKEYRDICSNFLHIFYDDCILKSEFPDAMKMADITPAHKKDDKTSKENYRPVSILSSTSKIFEKMIYEDVSHYMDNKLSPYLCGFRKGYSTQHCLIVMLEKWKKALDKKNVAGALLTDLSKAFDCLNHELLIAKLDAYGFDHASLYLILSYLTGRKQRTKVNNSYSDWSQIESGIPQGSIMGPLLFNIYINDLFYFINEDRVTNYADDTTPYNIEKNVENVISNLQVDSETLLNWFNDNFFKLNADKCKLLVTNHEDEVSIKIGRETIKGKKSVKLLGVKIDNKLNFKEHVSDICKKASLKLHALARVSHLMNKDKLRLIMKAFIDSQFTYCPLIWMFHSRTLNNKINKLHERALRLVYKDYDSTFQQLLDKDKSFSIHHRNLQILATEMFKINHNMSPSIMNTTFPPCEKDYNFRNQPSFKTENIKTVFYGSETLLFRGPKIWALVPNEIKASNSLNEFKIKIKSWKPDGCNCRICKIYIPNLGFIS